jgi:hypothetical protein
MLAVLFFSANIMSAKDKQSLNAKKDTVTVNKSPVMEAILKAEQAEQSKQTIVYVRDTVQTIELKNLDFSTPDKTKESIAWIIAVILALLPRFVPKIQDWLTQDKVLQGIKIVSVLAVIIVSVLKFGTSTINVATVVELIFAIAGFVGLVVNPLMKYALAKK